MSTGKTNYTNDHIGYTNCCIVVKRENKSLSLK
jgi:hypothetical protein